MHAAAEAGQAACMSLLLERGAAMVADKEGVLAMDLAIKGESEGHTECVRLLEPKTSLVREAGGEGEAP